MTSSQSSSAHLRGHIKLAADPRTVFEDQDSGLLQTNQMEIPINLLQNEENCFKAAKVTDVLAGNT